MTSPRSPTIAATRMKRCPVLLHLALIIVALFADDVNFIAQLPTAGGVESNVAVQSDTSAPLKAIRLADADSSIAEVARGGRLTRDAVAKPFAGLQIPLNAVCAGTAASFRQPPLSSSSLVFQHTRLQI